MRQTLKDKKLDKALKRFVTEMRKQLIKKEQEGFSGWDYDNIISTKYLVWKAKLKLDDLMKLPYDLTEQEIDIANFMLMIWYRNKKTAQEISET